MKLRNRQDGRIYYVRTEDDNHGGFMIFAQDDEGEYVNDFCMHYRTLEEFTDDWEDVD